MFGFSLTYLDKLIDADTIVIKRHVFYMYKIFVYFFLWIFLFLFEILLFESLSFINMFSFILGTLWFGIFIYYTIKYIFIFKIYFVLTDKNILVQQRKIFLGILLLTLMYFMIFIFIEIILLLQLYFHFFSDIDVLQTLFLLVIFPIKIVLYYLMLKRIFNIEADFVICNSQGIQKETHNKFFYVFPYFIPYENILDLKINHQGFWQNVFNFGTISVYTRREERHYNYISHPDEIYEILETQIQKHTSSLKNKFL